MIQRTRIIQKLRKHELFSSVDPVVLESALDGESKVSVFHRGEKIADDLMLSKAAVFILSGSVIRLNVVNNICFERLSEGELCGLTSLLHEGKSFKDILYATKESQVLFLSKTAIHRLFESDPAFSFAVIRFLFSRVSALERRVSIYTGGDARCRLARFLLDAFGDCLTFHQDRSMQYLATLLDISRPSLYRAFAELQDAGAIKKEGKTITLLDKDMLTQFVSFE